MIVKKVILLIMLSFLVFGGCSRKANKALADYSGDINETWEVRGNVHKRLSDYHKFENTFQQIQGYKANMLMRLNNGETFKDISSEIMIMNQWISEYNSDSRAYDKALWKSNSLPYQINLITSEEDLRNL
jgi:hypothetical protein